MLSAKALPRSRQPCATRLAPHSVAAVQIRSAHGRVIVTGMGKSGHIARKIAATLGFDYQESWHVFVHASAEASHGDLGMIAADDVMLALSWSGETEELKDLINYSRRFRIGLIAVTVKRQRRKYIGQSRGRRADAAERAREACPHNLAPTT